jgi:hypothetical protein
MFNRSRSRIATKEWVEPKDVSDEYEEEHKYHKALQRNPGREPSIQQQGKDYALRAFMHNADDPASVSLKDMMREYYFYLQDYDKEYLKRLEALVGQLIIRFSNDPENIQRELAVMRAQESPPAQVVQPTQPQPASPQMGAPNIMGIQLGGSENENKTASHAIYLKRTDGDYVLHDSFVGKLASGRLHYFRSNGKMYSLDIGDSDIAVTRESAAARAAMSIQEEMPKRLTAVLAEFLRSYDDVDAERMARAFMAEAISKGAFDLLPIVVKTEGAVAGFAFRQGLEESRSAKHLAIALGKATEEMIDALRSALAMEDIATKETMVDLPNDVPGRSPTRDARILRRGLDKSMDMKSLILTMSSQGSDERKKGMAIDRIIALVCEHPDVYAERRLSKHEIQAIGRIIGCPSDGELCSKLERLAFFVQLSGASDAELMAAYGGAGMRDRLLIAAMVARQDRPDIVRVNPSMATQKDDNGNILVCRPFLKKIDVRDDHAVDFVATLVEAASHGVMRRPDDVSDKAMEALLLNGSERLLEAMLGSAAEERYFALSWLAEQAGGDGLDRALKELAGRPATHAVSEVVRAMCASALVGEMPEDDGMRVVFGALRVPPVAIRSMVGHDAATRYMRANRIDWDGEPVPTASNIHSLPDDPLALAKNLYDIAKAGDQDAIAALYKLFHMIEAARHRGLLDMDHTARYLQEALVNLGANADMIGALVSARTCKPEFMPHYAMLLPDGSVLIGSGGKYFVEGTPVCFASERKDALGLAMQWLGKGEEPNRGK